MKLMGTVIVIILLVISTAGCVSDDELKELEDENKKLKKQNELLEDEKTQLGADMLAFYQELTNLTDAIDDLEVYIAEKENQKSPAVGFYPEPTNPIAPVKVAFTSFEADSDGIINITHWEFGDGTNWTHGNPLKINPMTGTTYHEYTEPGEYLVILASTDNDGNIAKSFIILTVD